MFHKQAEFIAAEAGQGVTLANMLSEQRRQLTEQFVAGSVSAGIVDHLEVVQVNVQQGVFRMAGGGGVQGTGHPGLEGAAVEQAGQGVMVGLVMEFVFIDLALADVVHHGGKELHGAIGGELGLDHQGDRNFLAPG